MLCKIYYTVIYFSLSREDLNLCNCLFQIIVFESLERLESFCCIFIYFITVFVAEESELAKIQQSLVFSFLEWDLGLGDLLGKCAVGEHGYPLINLRFLSLDPYRGIMPAG